ncbi:MAG: zf-HC2 domain-containing protein [Treponema sp.]|nr:zf-HC2 domain-containing protein [Treponema sp.]MCI7567199.1 zf-HC2 domain-containing protein [Treponema sp.]
MSFCLSKDIHSIYLDKELPENYKLEYEEHVKNCPECQKELNKLKLIHDALKSDSDSIKLDDDFLEKSYERLQIKMAYKNNVTKARRTSNVNIKYGLTAVAAAALFALVIPVTLNSNKKNSVTTQPALASVSSVSQISNSTSAIAANNVSINSGRNVLVSGNMLDTVIRPEAGIDNGKTLVKKAKDVEVLRPELEDETISIRISVPGLGEIPVVTEINLPMGAISGKF